MRGVLIDSYHAHCRSWCDVAGAEGITFTEKDFAESFGRTSRDIIAKHFGDDLSSTEIMRIDNEKELRYRQIVGPQCALV